MSLDALLSRLDRVKQTGSCRYIARCPAHNDKHPSLAIRELDDGRILLKCFAECAVGDVLSSLGLEFPDLFPNRLAGHARKPERKPFYAGDILQCIAFEAMVAAVAAGNIAQGIELTEDDHDRLSLAAGRLQAAAEMVSHA